MVLDEILRMDQNTIGAKDLRLFISALDDVAGQCEQQPSVQLEQAALKLRVVLGEWMRLFNGSERIGGATESNAGAQAIAFDGAATNIAVLCNIERHLDRLVLRHSNFGYALANVPSSLDDHFPESALIHVRTALPHLRAATALLSISS